jgi:hypothetical protein
MNFHPQPLFLEALVALVVYLLGPKDQMSYLEMTLRMIPTPTKHPGFLNLPLNLPLNLLLEATVGRESGVRLQLLGKKKRP